MADGPAPEDRFGLLLIGKHQTGRVYVAWLAHHRTNYQRPFNSETGGGRQSQSVNDQVTAPPLTDLPTPWRNATMSQERNESYQAFRQDAALFIHVFEQVEAVMRDGAEDLAGRPAAQQVTGLYSMLQVMVRMVDTLATAVEAAREDPSVSDRRFSRLCHATSAAYDAMMQTIHAICGRSTGEVGRAERLRVYRRLVRRTRAALAIYPGQAAGV